MRRAASAASGHLPSTPDRSCDSRATIMERHARLSILRRGPLAAIRAVTLWYRTGRLRRGPTVVPQVETNHLLRSVVLPYGAMALARPVCGEPGGPSALWRCQRRSGAPAAVGGRRHCRGPPMTRPAACPLGHLVAGLLRQHARVEAGSKGNFLCSQPRASSLPVGRRERRPWNLPRLTRPGWPIVPAPSASSPKA
jgi:hypothetical protein